MSTSEPSTTLPRTVRDSLGTVAGPVDRLLARAVGFLQLLAFWTATLLPLTYVPLLVGGILTTRPMTFGALLVVNVVAMVLGHGHKRPA